MRRWSKPHRKRGISLTPLIDVVFLLLIFFVMAGRFSDESRLVLKAEAPTNVATTSSKPPPMMLVQVASDGGLSMLGQSLDAAGLAARKPDDASLVLRLAPDMPLEIMVAVIDGLKAAGIEEMSYWPGSGR